MICVVYTIDDVRDLWFGIRDWPTVHDVVFIWTNCARIDRDRNNMRLANFDGLRMR